MKKLKLKALEICGFKSFADKTRLTFDKPVTVVVGPNGSGKSNISDAILWVTGEQSSKALRGGKMEDVIFGGTQKRKQMGYAEVSLILDNEDGRLPMPNTEVMITRRYFRSGESEYYINRAQCRLRDVNELLMDTGMGREGYSIIGQGKIDQILSVKSTDRRSIFEEAAGISRYRHRKEESERKLQRTEENLLRVNDKISELELQVEPLRKQSEKAKKYLLLRDELRDLEIGLWTDSLKKLAMDRDSLEQLGRENAARVERAQQELDSFYAESDRFSQRMQEKDLAAEKLRSELSSNEALTAEQESSAAVLRANMESAASERLRIENELAEQENRDESLRSQIEERQARLEEIAGQEAQLKAKAEGLSRSLLENTRSSEESDRQTALLLEEEQQHLQAIAEEKNLIAGLAAAAQEMEDRDASSHREALSAAERLNTLEQEAALCAGDLQEAEEKLAELENIIKGYRMRCDSRRAKAEAAAETCRKLEMDSSNLQSRIAMLTEMEKDYSGYTRAVKTVMQEAGRGLLKGIYGTVGSLLQTRDRYATAVETALGGSMQDIIVADEESGKACINLLKRRDAGRGTFLPCRTMKGTELDVSGLKGEEGFVGTALSLITFDEAYRGVYTYLLGRTAVAEDMDDAIRISRRYPKKFKIVTLDGQVINPSGSMTGGSAAKNAGILSRANELQNLKERSLTLEQQLQQAQQSLRSARSEEENAAHALQLSLNEQQQKKDALVHLQANHSHYQLMLESARSAEADYRQESRQLQQRLEANSQEIARRREVITREEALLEELRGRIAGSTRGKDALLAARSDFMEKSQEIRESLASLAAEKQSQLSACEELTRLQTGLTGGRERQNQYLEDLRDRETRMEAQLQELTERLKAMHGTSDRLRQQLESLNQEKLALEGERNRHSRRMQEHNERLLQLQREASALEQKLLSAQMEEKQLVDKLWDTYELTRSRAMELAQIPENLPEAKKRAAELKRGISALGTPNLGAIEEYERVNERYTYLTGQRDDIEKAKGELTGIIDDITEEMKTIFAAEFVSINQQFQQTFLELFGGGRANLELEDENDILNCGIEIKVQPPGKSLKTITLLSGGEKAFVAIALYFAVLKVRPAPFVVMDEIEAALDEANVSRFAGYMRQMSGNTQMVVISHRRGTMEEADMLYGVTMQEQGVSRVLNIDLDEAERTIAK